MGMLWCQITYGNQWYCVGYQFLQVSNTIAISHSLVKVFFPLTCTWWPGYICKPVVLLVWRVLLRIALSSGRNQEACCRLWKHTISSPLKDQTVKECCSLEENWRRWMRRRPNWSVECLRYRFYRVSVDRAPEATSECLCEKAQNHLRLTNLSRSELQNHPEPNPHTQITDLWSSLDSIYFSEWHMKIAQAQCDKLPYLDIFARITGGWCINIHISRRHSFCCYLWQSLNKANIHVFYMEMGMHNFGPASTRNANAKSNWQNACRINRKGTEDLI